MWCFHSDLIYGLLKVGDLLSATRIFLSLSIILVCWVKCDMSPCFEGVGSYGILIFFYGRS